MTERVAVIDLGSNSARLIVMHIYKNGAYNLVYNQKETVRLSEGMSDLNILQADAMNRAIDTLKIFSHMCQLFEVNKILAVATAAVRNALNGRDFLEKVKKETGIILDIISGEQESYLGYLGVINTIDVKNALLFDLGGGSTEITLVKDRQVIECLSLPMGAVNMTERFKTNDKISDQTLSALTDYIMSNIKKINWLKNIRLPLVGIGGTSRNIAKMDQKRKNYPSPKIHNYRLGQLSFNDLYRSLISTNYSQRRKIPGLNNERADIIVAGTSIVKCLFDITGSNRLITSGCGVREGLFFDYYLTRLHDKNIVDHILDHSVNNILLFYKNNYSHAHHVMNLACEMFDGWLELHKLTQRDREILKVAALLHDIGITINYYDHSRHSAYLIENARLFGLTHREQILASVIAGWHNGPANKYFRSRIYNEFLDEVDWQIAHKLSLILALAEALDTTQMSFVSKVAAEYEDKTASLTLTYTNKPLIELQALEKHLKWFKKEFDTPLVIN